MALNHLNSQAMNNKKIPKIKGLVMMGDSLSDRGRLNNRMVFGCIPMSWLSGLAEYSPEGRFTNGWTWSDHLSAKFASDFTIHRIQKKWHLDKTDISDAIINRDSRILKEVKVSYSLDNNKFVNYDGKLWIRSYCEGGLTAYDYSWQLSADIMRFFTRFIVAKLSQMSNELLAYDKKHNLSNEEKAETLIVEWSGANDLVTVNAKPSKEEVDKAINARVNNVKKLIANGYQHFVLFNLPDLSLTPRYQASSKEEQDNAHECSLYFNTQLIKACQELNEDFPQCTIKPFDISILFADVYQNPKKYGFDENKKTQPYINSKEFDDPSDGLSPASGYMFYDDLHPSADLHALLANHFYDQLEQDYEFLEPSVSKANPAEHFNPRAFKANPGELLGVSQHEINPALTSQNLLKIFRKHYEAKLSADKHSFFKIPRSNLNVREADLSTIFKHALYEKGHRTFEVLNNLGWLDTKGQLRLDTPVLQKAMELARASQHEDNKVFSC